MLKIIHFSDTHLGYSNWDKVTDAGVNAREQDFYDAFTLVIDAILEQKPDYVIHSGDFFHRPSPSNRALTFAVQQLTRLVDLNIPFIIIAGNHETPKTIYTSPILKIFTTFSFVYPIFGQEYETIHFPSITFHGLPHINDTTILHQQIQKINPVNGTTNILLLHTSIGKKYVMEEQYGEQIYPEEVLEKLKGFDYIALGHWHNFQQVLLLPNAWYVGSTERMSDTESSTPKGYCTLLVEKNTSIIPLFTAIPTRDWHKISIHKANTKSIQEIEQELHQNLSAISLQDSIVYIDILELLPDALAYFTNSYLKELTANAFQSQIRRTAYQQDSYFKEIEYQETDSLQTLFTGYVHQKYQDTNQAELLLQKAKKYFQIKE